MEGRTGMMGGRAGEKDAEPALAETHRLCFSVALGGGEALESRMAAWEELWDFTSSPLSRLSDLVRPRALALQQTCLPSLRSLSLNYLGLPTDSIISNKLLSRVSKPGL